ncbi:MAG: efflux RND transporter periplasmic adaptor subunit [Luminiphilus sp.]|nr:efflux RND transporter periplasmic adaptor subunit [Luminiphilus sp.]
MNPNLVQSLWAVALAVLLTLGGTALIKANKVTTTSAERTPMPVAATTYREQASYVRKATYLGVVRAGSDSVLGFEVAGVLTSLTATEGMRVSAGDALAQLGIDRRQTRLDAAAAAYDRVVAERAQAEARANRIASLIEDGSASQQDYDDARFTVQALTAAENTAAAQRQSAQLELEKSTLLAPYEAVVAERLVQTGAVVAPGTPVMRLVTATGREAHVGVPPHVARKLITGNPYTLSLQSEQVTAVLRSIRDDIDSATLTVGAVFDMPDDTSVAVGESAALQVAETVGSSGGWLPVTSLLEASRGLWDVLTITPDSEGRQRARRESVEILYTRGSEVFVRGTLPPEVSVVASGLQRISPGDLVEPVFSQARPNESLSGS